MTSHRIISKITHKQGPDKKGIKLHTVLVNEAVTALHFCASDRWSLFYLALTQTFDIIDLQWYRSSYICQCTRGKVVNIASYFSSPGYTALLSGVGKSTPIFCIGIVCMMHTPKCTRASVSSRPLRCGKKC